MMIFKQFNIKKLTYAPSVYGFSKTVFKHDRVKNEQGDFKICMTTDDYYNELKNRIQNSILNESAVLVFFENDFKIDQFLKSGYCEFYENNGVISLIYSTTPNKLKLIE